MPKQRSSQRGSAEPKLNSRGIWNWHAISSASASALAAARGEKPLDVEEVVERLSMFPAIGYYLQPITEAQRKERIRKWSDAVGRVPGGFVLGAFDEWFEKGTRAPVPGEIRSRALELRGYATSRLTALTPEEDREPAPPLECTAEEIARRHKFIEELSAEFPDLRRGKP